MKKIISITLALCLCVVSMVSASANDIVNNINNSKKYIDEVYFLLMDEELCDNYREFYSKMYSVIYEYSSADEATPDYVCVFAGFDFGPALSYGVFGDYIIRQNNCYFPYEVGYYVYIPANNEIYTLKQAMEFPEINRLFTDYGVGELIGDVNRDRKISIQDATEIQKFIAKITESYEIEDEIIGICEQSGETLHYISDYNRDGERNIKDATAIQKHIAGLEY